MTRHIPVLLNEVVEGLNLKEGDIFLDGTLGGGGHSAEVAEKFGDEIEIVGLDRDAKALARSELKLKEFTSSIFLREASFRHLDEVLQGLGISQVNAILFDLGISSDQLEPEEGTGQGFSFQRDEPLSMQMKQGEGVSAAEILNTWDEDTLELILRGFGEERFSRRLAKAIVTEREDKPFKTTFDLVRLVEEVVPKGRQKTHRATRTFQALRIAVNEELVALEEGLIKGFEKLAPNGRFAVISFHSLEDRIVKNFFRDRVKEGKAKFINKKPIIPTETEARSNPRSRSAKLRILEKL